MVKKTAIALAFSIVTVNAFAQPIPAAQLPSYKKAVKLAVGYKNLACTSVLNNIYDYKTLDEVLDATTSADLDLSGAQPLLVFSKGDNQNRMTASVTTSADYKSVVSILVAESSAKSTDVNSGTIANPSISTQVVWSDDAVANCK